LIDRLLEPPGSVQLTIEQGWRVGGAAVDKRVSANPDQAKSGRAVGFPSEQASGGVIQRVRELGRVGHAARARAYAEIGGL
jgi:hypothetical protein